MNEVKTGDFIISKLSKHRGKEIEVLDVQDNLVAIDVIGEDYIWMDKKDISKIISNE